MADYRDEWCRPGAGLAAAGGVAQVLHARWRDHAYPGHTHDTWTLLQFLAHHALSDVEVHLSQVPLRAG